MFQNHENKRRYVFFWLTYTPRLQVRLHMGLHMHVCLLVAVYTVTLLGPASLKGTLSKDKGKVYIRSG